MTFRTRCCECKKLKSINGFSKRQQNEFRHGIARGQVDVDDLSLSWIKCFQCTGAQTHELECCMCGTIKGLDGFTKAQRRNPDSAVGAPIGYVVTQYQANSYP